MHNHVIEGTTPITKIIDAKSIIICHFLRVLLLEIPEKSLTKACPKKNTEMNEISLFVNINNIFSEVTIIIENIAIIGSNANNISEITTYVAFFSLSSIII